MKTKTSPKSGLLIWVLRPRLWGKWQDSSLNKDRYVPRPYLLASGVPKMWKKITAFRNRVLNLFPKLLLLCFFCFYEMVTAAAKSPQSCPTLCDPIDGSPPGSPVPGIFQARTLEWVAISFSNAWKWKVKLQLLSRVRLLATPWTTAYQAPPSMGFSRQEYWSGVPFPSPLCPLIPSKHIHPSTCHVVLELSLSYLLTLLIEAP